MRPWTSYSPSLYLKNRCDSVYYLEEKFRGLSEKKKKTTQTTRVYKKLKTALGSGLLILFKEYIRLSLHDEHPLYSGVRGSGKTCVSDPSGNCLYMLRTQAWVELWLLFLGWDSFFRSLCFGLSRILYCSPIWCPWVPVQIYFGSHFCRDRTIPVLFNALSVTTSLWHSRM